LETAAAKVLGHNILVERLAMTSTEVELARLEMAIAEVLRAIAEITAARETMARELGAIRTPPRGGTSRLQMIVVSVYYRWP
jgi:hypothetical protein